MASIAAIAKLSDRIVQTYIEKYRKMTYPYTVT
jgi:hypothetical protein